MSKKSATPEVKNTETSQPTEADKIWSEIQNLEIGMFALPNQRVSGHVTKINLPGDQLYVKLNSSAVLPNLEAVLRGRFEIEATEGYTIIRRATAEDTKVTKALAEMKMQELRDRANAAVMKK